MEKFYRETKIWLVLKEYQVRNKTSLIRQFILVFCSLYFHYLSAINGRIKKRYANKPLTNFTETLEAFITAISYNFFCWLREHEQVLVKHKANLGFVWGQIQV